MGKDTILERGIIMSKDEWSLYEVLSGRESGVDILFQGGRRVITKEEQEQQKVA